MLIQKNLCFLNKFYCFLENMFIYIKKNMLIQGNLCFLILNNFIVSSKICLFI